VKLAPTSRARSARGEVGVEIGDEVVAEPSGVGEEGEAFIALAMSAFSIAR